ncbi:hypothetical protein AVEN_197872-1 [Araneus ventricosus]|uniref:Uncharacterized protein n=1 Tax=Araneus ventricosus TaxID=182803 RepID=A0A4Y2T178_ARAVE|nr:hypothetical protein AVEN_197872-1 [Araneus ventricosus]
MQYLESERPKEKTETKQLKRNALEEEIDFLKQKKMFLQTDMHQTNEKANDLANEAENLDIESDFEERVKQIGKIHFGVKPRFALLPSSDLPENFCTDIPESFSAKLKAAVDTESICDSLDTFSEDSLSVNTEHSSHSSVQASFKYRDYAKMQPETVVVSHITNPSSFFVQRCSELRKLKTMSDAIDKWCKGYESKKHKVVELEPGTFDSKLF